MTTSVLLAGTSGYGRRHLDQLLSWHADGVIRLAALVDLNVTEETRQLAAAADPFYAPTVDEAFAARDIDLAVVATPPHTHFPIAKAVLDNGKALYLEKPPFPLFQQLDALDPVRRAEVGFQLARAAIEAAEAAIATGAIGDVNRITAHGCLTRPDSYYSRSPWAGAWFADGQAILDGALFNPLAHIVHAALTLAGRLDDSWTPESVQAECYSVHAISGDDTSVIRVRSASGPEVLAVGTTAADIVSEPAITIHGTRGQLTIQHRDATGQIIANGIQTDLPPRTPPPPPLLAAVRDPDGSSDPLINFAAVRPFVTVVNAAVQAVGTPTSITQYEQTSVRVLPGISALIKQVVATGSLFSELGVAWACQAGSIDLRGYAGLSHPALRPACSVDREAR